MTTQILTSPKAKRAEYSLPEAERLALLPAPKRPGESKPKLKEIKQVQRSFK